MASKLPRTVRHALDEVELRAGAVDRQVEESTRNLIWQESRLEERVAEIERATDVFRALKQEYEEAVARPDTIPGLVETFWREKERIAAELHEYDLLRKRRPAPHAAEQVAAARRELAEEKALRKRAEFELALYEYDFPWLAEYRSIEVDDGVDSESDADANTDPTLRYLSDAEYQGLSAAGRNQLALDRYVASRKKSKWQIGRDYELYVGYLCSQRRCRVRYQGILERFEDLGRDVIAETDTAVEIIQCKYWSTKKVLRENSIFQLAGTVLAAQLDERSVSNRVVRGHLFTSTVLSPVAEAFARQLDIELSQEQPLCEFPRIKCNLSRPTGERIYHLPFDQQYDATIVEPKRGEFFAWTAEEAEAAGFRRAWRWSYSEEAAD